eukprot:405414_1
MEHNETFAKITIPRHLKCNSGWFNHVDFFDGNLSTFKSFCGCYNGNLKSYPTYIKRCYSKMKGLFDDQRDAESYTYFCDSLFDHERDTERYYTYYTKNDMKKALENKTEAWSQNRELKTFLGSLDVLLPPKIDNIPFSSFQQEPAVSNEVDVYSLCQHQETNNVVDPILQTLGLRYRFHFEMNVNDIQPLLLINNELSVQQNQRDTKRYVNMALELFEHKFGTKHPDNGWNVYEYPEWLAFELVSGMIIRQKQIDITFHMLQKQQIITQLNMGEGKTSVILPILALHISNGLNKVARIMVLRSLFRTNMNSLHCVFGMLGRRILAMHCSRDKTIDGSDLLSSLEQCKERRGILITIPDDMMSMNLKIREYKYNGNTTHFTQLNQVKDWINLNVQTIMDEADEICHFRNQLIYPIGVPQLIDGKSQRWRIAMAVFEGLMDIVPKLKERHVDFDRHIEYKEVGNGAAAQVRLLTNKYYKEICDGIIEFILDNKAEFSFLNEDIIKNWTPKQKHDIIKHIASSPNEDNKLILILRGLLQHQCLATVLQKRHRVNYGLHPTREIKTDLAVPYRAKNVPSERAEFSHPDISICYTILSYYHDGLDQVKMQKLMAHETMSQYYDLWMNQMDINTNIPRQWKYVNCSDRIQYSAICNALKHAMPVIHFCLDKFVFPTYAKQFPHKLSNSPWNITQCYEQCASERASNQHPVIGFSGTNGISRLYPLSITQNDLEFVKNTNCKLDEMLSRFPLTHHLQSNKKLFPHDLNDMNTNINILLDVGAIVQYENKTFAQKWLELRSDMKAVLFFDTSNRLKVLMRTASDQNTPFEELLYEISYFKGNLKHVLVYLDDFHCRGTDLPFPDGSIACLTLGAGLERDKLAQGAMRMRKLESKKHSIEYLCSYDVKMQLETMNHDIVKWSKENTTKMIHKGLPIWMNQGSIYYQNKDIEQEITLLQEFYGALVQKVPISKIVRDISHRSSHSGIHEILQHITKHFDSDDIKISPLSLDEEQERELERELENETKVQRPPKQMPRIPKISRLLKTLVRIQTDRNLRDQYYITESNECEFVKGWRPYDELLAFYMSDEYKYVRNNQSQWHSEQCVDYLRPATWVCIRFGLVGLWISPFEADYLKEHLSSNKDAFTSLYMVCPRVHKGQTFGVVPVVGQALNKRLEALLMIYAGNLFFNEQREFDTFCDLNSLALKPYNDTEKEARNNNEIEDDGFVKNPLGRLQFVLRDIGCPKIVAVVICEMIGRPKYVLNASPIPKIKEVIENERNEEYLIGSDLHTILCKIKKIN